MEAKGMVRCWASTNVYFLFSVLDSCEFNNEQRTQMQV